MDTKIQIDEKLVEAFHLMYDHFPEGAQLTHKSKQIMAVNPVCKAMGREVGMICSQLGEGPEAHKGCLANKSIKDHKAKWSKAAGALPSGQEPVAFWLPIDGHPDFFIHFGVGYKNYSEPCED